MQRNNGGCLPSHVSHHLHLRDNSMALVKIMGNNLIDLRTIIYAAVDRLVNTKGEISAISRKTTDKHRYEESVKNARRVHAYTLEMYI